MAARCSGCPLHDYIAIALLPPAQPWSGVAEAILKPLPADWRHNIQSAFSQMGEALGKLLGGGEQAGQKVGAALQGVSSITPLLCPGLHCDCVPAAARLLLGCSLRRGGAQGEGTGTSWLTVAWSQPLRTPAALGPADFTRQAGLLSAPSTSRAGLMD